MLQLVFGPAPDLEVGAAIQWDCWMYYHIASDMSLSNEELVQINMEAEQRAVDGAQCNMDGGYYGIAASRAYYAFLYAATAPLLTRDISRSKHSGVLSAFREHFVKPGLIEAEFSDTDGEAFDVRQVTDYDMVGVADEAQAQAVLDNARRFVVRITHYLVTTQPSCCRRLKPRLPLRSRPSATEAQSAQADFARVAAISFARQ